MNALKQQSYLSMGRFLRLMDKNAEIRGKKAPVAFTRQKVTLFDKWRAAYETIEVRVL